MDATSWASFWAFAGLIIFLGILVYFKVPSMMAKNLDKRADDIAAELEQAKKLREEAQQLLAEYQRKRNEAEEEAKSIVAAAEKEAAALREDAPARADRALGDAGGTGDKPRPAVGLRDGGIST